MSSFSVSIIVVPESLPSSVTGPMDVLASSGLLLNALAGNVPKPSFHTQLVAETNRPLRCFNNFIITPTATFDTVEKTNFVIIPSLAISPSGIKNKYPHISKWLQNMYRGGATIASICTGAFLLAESGLLNKREATTHWAFSEVFRAHYPSVTLSPEKSIVATDRIVSVGAGSAWHDLVLKLINDTLGRKVALESAKMFLLQNHDEGQQPFDIFIEKNTHNDAVILEAQKWLADNIAGVDLILRCAQYTNLNPRTFKHRFKQATELSPLHYIQKLRLERAKEALELTKVPIEDISRSVGYQDASFFRRVFKRGTGLTPNEYRRQFGMQF